MTPSLPATLVLAILASPPLVVAQTSGERIPDVVKAGLRVSIVDEQARKIDGRVHGVSEHAIRVSRADYAASNCAHEHELPALVSSLSVEGAPHHSVGQADAKSNEATIPEAVRPVDSHDPIDRDLLDPPAHTRGPSCPSCRG